MIMLHNVSACSEDKYWIRDEASAELVGWIHRATMGIPTIQLSIEDKEKGPVKGP